MDKEEILSGNKDNYEHLYAKGEAFLRYPADWVVRFHNMFLKNRFPDGGTALDYGCGSGNNAVFLTQKGFQTYGVDVAPSFTKLVEANLDLHHIDTEQIRLYQQISAESTELPFADESFEFILSNQVLYYLPDEDHIRAVCAELNRVLKPGGIVFFTMMGPRNYYITHHTKNIINSQIYDVQVTEPGHRLEGVQERIFLVRDEDHCRDLFDTFKPLTVGHFEQSMFDMGSNFHWIYWGEKKAG